MYRKASFRGVEFEVESRDFESGRRLNTHEYPNKDRPYIEDMGKKAETFSIKAFIVGQNYQERRNALREACLKEGVGILIHPDFGSLKVKCDTCNIHENREQGGMAIFDLTFIEAGINAIPETSINLSEVVTKASGNLLDAAIDDFSTSFEVPSGISSLTSLVEGIADTCAGVLNMIGSGLDYAQGIADGAISAMNKVVDAATTCVNMKEKMKTLLNTPKILANQLSVSFDVVKSLAGNKSNNKKSYDAFKTIQNLKADANKSETANTSNSDAIAEKRAMQQVEQFVKQIVVAKEAEVITEIDFTNSDEANSVLNSFINDTEEIELFEDIEPSNEIIQTLREVREAVIEYMRENILDLPNLKVVKIKETTSSLALAYDLYEDLDRADEIVNRNKIEHPAFIPAGKELKVLTE